MAITPSSPATTPATALDTAFVADRQVFWHRFTSFSKWAVIAVIVVLAGLYVFVV